MEWSEIVGVIVAVILVVFIMSLILAFPILWLWNWLCPMLFGLPIINIWQAWGLGLLTGFLFRTTVNNNQSK